VSEYGLHVVGCTCGDTGGSVFKKGDGETEQIIEG
jgi:hypothetical protein